MTSQDEIMSDDELIQNSQSMEAQGSNKKRISKTKTGGTGTAQSAVATAAIVMLCVYAGFYVFCYYYYYYYYYTIFLKNMIFYNNVFL